MDTKIILGTLFGDEGKGLVTSTLASKGDLVVRYNGGHQAGHTVIKDKFRHVFSSFGAGTLNGAHTYISEYCTVYPMAFNAEALLLTDFDPKVFVHPMAMITTPFDIFFNHKEEREKKHGSVGVGFGTTIKRNEESPYKLYAIDLKNKDVVTHKLKMIAKYYDTTGYEYYGEPKVAEVVEVFIGQIGAWLKKVQILTLAEIKNNYKNIIFEGAQGVMLDRDFGFFPNVTRAHTTSRNAMQIVKDNGLPYPKIYYVMRSYLTRHGNGWMPNEDEDLNFEDRTNKAHSFQGKLRFGSHSLSLIRHALGCDSVYSQGLNKSIVITCLNQTEDFILMGDRKMSVGDFMKSIPIQNAFTSHNEHEIREFKK